MKKKIQTYYFSSDPSFSPKDFSNKLWEFVSDYYKKNGRCPIQFLCIGSDRIIGDSLGPLLGYKLEHYRHQSEHISPAVYQLVGTLSHPIHALNMEQTAYAINRQKRPHLTIAVDASVGLRESFGNITISNQPLNPGEGVHRQLPRMGQISITGIVSDETDRIPFHMQSIRLGHIMQITDCIYQGIITFLQSYSSQLPVPAEVPDFPDRNSGMRSASACASDPWSDVPHKYL